VPRSSLWGWIVPLPPPGRRGPLAILRWLLSRIFLGFVLICLMLALLQRTLIYHRSQAERIAASEEPVPAGMLHDVTVTSTVGTLHGWHMLPSGETASTREECDRLLADAPLVVLYFSGNAGHRGYRTSLMEVHAQLGAHVFLIDYRGYADNPGSPSESGLVEDAHAAWRMLTEERHVPPSKIVLYGESLGGGVATRLASDVCKAGTPPAALIIMASFSSLCDTAASHFPWLPVRWLLIDRYCSDVAIKDITCPLLQFHGLQDSVVPFTLGQRLFEAAPATSASGIAKTFVPLKNADHNDIFLVASGKVREQIALFYERLK
jgi:fermentation-respiration switch protein FrsA (DUF1100 family)